MTILGRRAKSQHSLEAEIAGACGGRARDLLLAVWLLGWSLFIAPACGPAGIQYDYDENNRLIAVVDPTQPQPNGRQYHYDAAGNLTSISALDTGHVGVLGFSPPCGTPGATTVTIHGVGFDPTPGNDLVTFTGATGVTPSSATNTQLTVAVPTSAANGPITVTVAGIPSTSVSSFRADGCGAPTIGGVTPQYGAPLAAIQISGTNFDPTAANDRVAVGEASVAVTSVSPLGTNLNAIAGVRSGRVTVSTPRGNAIGPDFFVIPGAFASSSVDQVKRMTIPGTDAVTIAFPGHMALIAFDAPSGGHRLYLAFSSPAPDKVALVAPDGSDEPLVLQNATSLESSNPLALGTHTLVVKSLGSQTGTFTVTLGDIVDVRSITTLGGPAIPIALGPLQYVYLTFQTTVAYQGVTLLVTVHQGSPPPCLYASVGDSIEQPICGSATMDVVGGVHGTVRGLPQISTALVTQRTSNGGGLIELQLTSP